ncbi:hypothetical protein J3459_014945 [Metarhizium acridum]|nr:hypothetical protein J3459_014945 [Metarhizium acridum]
MQGVSDDSRELKRGSSYQVAYLTKMTVWEKKAPDATSFSKGPHDMAKTDRAGRGQKKKKEKGGAGGGKQHKGVREENKTSGLRRQSQDRAVEACRRHMDGCSGSLTHELPVFWTVCRLVPWSSFQALIEWRRG